ncbi:MAG: hypothetical protein FJZ90_01230 [Chloroflexi bacterium]|nr:hypothetical protein [Chloroflexota bacterium]
MYDIKRLVLCLCAALTLAACVPLPPEIAAQFGGAAPAATSTPTTTPFPTPSEPPPDKPFTDIGSIAVLEGAHGISGRAVVAGRQTLIIVAFYYDGKAPAADIRLVKGEAYDQPAAVFLTLEQRPYENEYLLFNIPQAAGEGTADTLVVYAPDTGEVLAKGVFTQ